MNRQCQQVKVSFSIQDMLQNPEDFEVHPNWLHSYFESYTPNFLIYSSRPNNLAVKAEILVEMSAYNKYSSNLKFSTYFPRHVI